jgi:hypothetical protein
MIDSNPDMIWIVTLPSAYRQHQCLLGEGQTKAEAMDEAFGPKPWPKSSRNADCHQVTREELEEIKHASY